MSEASQGGAGGQGDSGGPGAAEPGPVVGESAVRGSSDTGSSDSGSAGPTQLPPKRGLFAVIGALMLGILLAALDQTIVGTALPTIVSELGGLEHLSWVVTGYMLAATVSTPLWGKLGDQYGRKGLFQAAIVIFLIGSILSGLAQGMLELILFRALQGLGGGGLMVLAIAIVGDVVPPRELGKYQGLFGAVFGVSSVAGPLLGGFFTDGPGWRWVFYINIPLGILALIVIGVTLHAREVKHKHTIDYAGVLLLGSAAAAIVLATSWGGTTYAWNSPEIIGLFVGAVVLLVGWFFAERRAAEPVLPLSLFKISQFSVTSALGFIIGFAMFGALTFLPLFLQVVHGVSPTVSGLQLLPMTAGMLLTSLTSGQIVSRTGHYKVFPILGTAVLVLALYLLSTMTETTSYGLVGLYFFVLGAGLGLVMQVLVIIVQNAVEYKDLGVATSAATFFRTIGGSFGTAVFGSIFANVLTTNMARELAGKRLPPTFDPSTLQQNRDQLERLPKGTQDSIIHAYAESIGTVFAWAIPIAVVGFGLAWFIRQEHLRSTSTAPVPGGGMPGQVSEASSREEVERMLSALLQRDSKARSAYVELGRSVDLDLTAGAIWALARLGREGSIGKEALAERAQVSLEAGRPYIDELVANGMVVRQDDRLVITAAGWHAAEKLFEARRQAVGRLLDGWHPEENPELTEILERLIRDSLDEQPPTRLAA